MSSVLPQALKGTCGAPFPPIFYFPQFSSCIFITEAIHSSAGRVTSTSHRLGFGGAGGERHVKPSDSPAVKPPTCGAQMVTLEPHLRGKWVSCGGSSTRSTGFLDVGFRRDSVNVSRKRGRCVLESPDTFWT